MYDILQGFAIWFVYFISYHCSFLITMPALVPNRYISFNNTYRYVGIICNHQTAYREFLINITRVFSVYYYLTRVYCRISGIVVISHKILWCLPHGTLGKVYLHYLTI